MKRILILIVLLCLCASVSIAEERKFEWDPNTEKDLAGYRLYKSAVSGQYDLGKGKEVAEIPAGTESLIYNVVPDGTYYFVLTAFDDAGNESGPSNEVKTTIDTTPPAKPGVLRCIRK